MRGDGKPVTLSAADIKALAASLRGPVLLADSAGYDTARRVLNPAIDKRPALIVQPTGTADVRRAVSFAAAHGLLLAVKCGGHSFSGMSTCDRGMQIDLSNMRGVRVDPAAKRAFVEGGTLLGLVDHEAAAHGMVTPLGTVSHTGVGGLTTGGGFGRLARRFGLAVDNVMAVDVVTADGSVKHADRNENPDLYWGVRGGGGNFGVVTNFEFALHPFAGMVTAGDMVFPFAKARDLLRFYAEFTPKAPDELYLDFVMAQPPGGKDGVALLHVCYSGDNPDRDLAPLKQLGTPMAEHGEADPLRRVPALGRLHRRAHDGRVHEERLHHRHQREADRRRDRRLRRGSRRGPPPSSRSTRAARSAGRQSMPARSRTATRSTASWPRCPGRSATTRRRTWIRCASTGRPSSR